MRAAAGHGVTGLALSVGLLVLLPSVATAQSERVEYYGLDALGSVRVVFDANGSILGRMDYGPFGQELSNGSGLSTRGYAGLFRDGETGLDYAETRSYQSWTGRFSTVDPVYAGLFDPQQWNRYSYALNSPMTFVDPNGRQAYNEFVEVRGHTDWITMSPMLAFLLGWGGGMSGGSGSTEDGGGGWGGFPQNPPPPPAAPRAFEPEPLPIPVPPEPKHCPAVPFTVTGVAPNQAPGTTAISRTGRADIPNNGVAIKPMNFGVPSVNSGNRPIFSAIELQVDWSTAAKPNRRAPAIPAGLPSPGPYTPVDVIGPKSVRDEPGNQIDLYNYQSFSEAFASTRFVMVTAIIPKNDAGVTCPK
jgi:RHS repeat-associated protein